MKMVCIPVWIGREWDRERLFTLIDGLVMADVVIVIQFESTNLERSWEGLNKKVKSREALFGKESGYNFAS